MQTPILRILLLLLTFGSVLDLSAQSRRSQPAVDTLPHAILWRIEGKDLKAPSYLLGTIHMIPRQDFFFTPAMESALAEVDKVVFEIDMRDMMDPSQIMGLMSASLMRGDTSLRDLLSQAEYERVDKYFQELGIPLSMFEHMKPMFLSILASSPELSASEDTDDTSYEMEIMQRAEAAAKDMGGLETVAFQLSIFDSIPYGVQARMLLESIDGEDLSVSADGLEEMVRLYKAQNLNGLQAAISEGTSGMGEFENMFIKNRNRNWIQPMRALMQQQRVFFAVGAGHLPGQDGVIRLLREAGYTLSPVKIF